MRARPRRPRRRARSRRCRPSPSPTSTGRASRRGTWRAASSSSSSGRPGARPAAARSAGSGELKKRYGDRARRRRGGGRVRRGQRPQARGRAQAAARPGSSARPTSCAPSATSAPCRRSWCSTGTGRRRAPSTALLRPSTPKPKRSSPRSWTRRAQPRDGPSPGRRFSSRRRGPRTSQPINVATAESQTWPSPAPTPTPAVSQMLAAVVRPWTSAVADLEDRAGAQEPDSGDQALDHPARWTVRRRRTRSPRG